MEINIKRDRPEYVHHIFADKRKKTMSRKPGNHELTEEQLADIERRIAESKRKREQRIEESRVKAQQDRERARLVRLQARQAELDRVEREQREEAERLERERLALEARDRTEPAGGHVDQEEVEHVEESPSGKPAKNFCCGICF